MQSSLSPRDTGTFRGSAQIVALLGERRARVRLQEAVGSDHRIAFVSRWTAVYECIRNLPVVLAVLDPRDGRAWQVEAVERLVRHHPSLRILLYLPFRPDAAGPLLRWARAGVRQIVFFDLGDSSLYLREMVEHALARSVPEWVYARIQAELDPLSEDVAEAFHLALLRAAEIDSAEAWAEAAGWPAGSFYRRFRAHGLPTPRRCLEWLRFLYAAKRLEDPGYEWDDLIRDEPPAPLLPTRGRAATPLDARELRYTVSFEVALAQFVRECRVAGTRRRAEAGE